MCGILGWAGYTCRPDAVSEAMDRLKPRGPDRGNIKCSESRAFGLGHQRLSINDLSVAGDQPMCTHDLALVCNGEIYNAPKLRQELEKLGYVFRSTSDNEVILHGYHAWRERIVEKLEGMFAFAIWETQSDVLFLARDPVGIKPLYIAQSSKTVAFASDAGALRHLMDSKPPLNPTALGYVLSLGYVPAPLAIWDGIQKLRPGHFAYWTPSTGLEEKKYWEPPRTTAQSVYTDAFSDLFENIVRDHLLSDVPMGLFLSGGLDSSAIAAATSNLNADILGLTVGFIGGKNDERPIAKSVAQHLKMKHIELDLDASDIKDLLHKTMRAFDEPQGYGGLIPLMLISEQASQNLRCVLSGDGGDEVFGGYTWYRDLQPTPTATYETWYRHAYDYLRGRTGDNRSVQKRFDQFANKSPIHRHARRQFPRFLPEEVNEVLTPLDNSFTEDLYLQPLREHFEPSLPIERALQRIDLMTFCSGSILPKVDRASMAHGLEVRVPFLDRRLIEYGLSLPISQDELETSKLPVRKYLHGRVPDDVLRHPKQGFSLQSAKNLDWDDIEREIFNGPLISNGLVSERSKQLVAPGTPYREGRLFALWALSVWVGNWV